MSSQKSALKQLFISKVVNKLYEFLASGVMREYGSTFVTNFAKDIVEEDILEINSYLKNNNVTLFTVNDHADKVLIMILIPYMNRKKIE